jgi:hypothetical protein
MWARHFTRAALPGILTAMSIPKPIPGSLNGPIEVRQTPNPNARKFILAGTRFVGSRNYALGEAVDHPLAAQLLTLDGVYNVLLVQDFVTVNKVPQVEWPPLQAAVEKVLVDYLSNFLSQETPSNAA